MGALLTNFRSTIEALILMLDYLGIGVALTVVAPELVLPFTGFLITRGEFSVLGVMVASTTGAVIGHVGKYYLAAWVGEARLHRLIDRYGHWLLLSRKDFTQSMERFERHHGWILIFGRFIPSVRTLVSFPAGIARMPLWRFSVLTAVSTFVCHLVLTLAGLLLGRNWESLLNFIDLYERTVWVVLVAMVLYLLGRRLHSRRTTTRQSET